MNTAGCSSSDVTARLRGRATFGRSLRLLAAWRHEQRDPAWFYGLLAADTAAMVAEAYRGATGRELSGTTVADVGAGPGYFAADFVDRGVYYLAIEPDPTALGHPASDVTAVRADGTALPLRDGAVNICLSSNVAEHVAEPRAMVEEMLRVTRSGGIVVVSYTVWWGPFGGHETGPWHLFGGEYAARRYRRKNGVDPKNHYGITLFPVGVADGLRWARSVNDHAVVLAAFPRYHPRWFWWLVQVPGLRECVVSNLVLVMGKR